MVNGINFGRLGAEGIVMNGKKNCTTFVGLATLIIGLVVGLGVGVWSVKTSHASNAPSSKPQSNTQSSTTADQNQAPTRDQWDPFREMEHMREQIDKAIHNATEEFKMEPSMAMFQPGVGYSSSFSLSDHKDHFELRAYLPDVEASDVRVKIDNDRALDISVTQRKQEAKNNNGANASFTELGQYEQVIALPEPVKSNDMKIDRQGHEIVVTIPKAQPTSTQDGT
jgi:HSP20 family molecular chaperone IbpA